MIKYIGKCLLIEEKGKKLLVIGDLHLGYEEHMNQSGVFVGRQMFNEMIEYLDKVFEKVGDVDEVVLLGDVKHDFGSIMKQEWQDVLGLFEYLEDRCKKITIIKGNHDKIIEPIARKSDVEVKDFYIWEGYCFIHGDRDFDEIYGKEVKYWVVGHGHPAVKISDGVKVEKYKCFLIGRYKKKKVILVPSFFAYNEGSDPRDNFLGMVWEFDFEKFEVKAVGKDLEVLDFGLLKNLN
jgi:uncharacterized protein